MNCDELNTLVDSLRAAVLARGEEMAAAFIGGCMVRGARKLTHGGVSVLIDPNNKRLDIRRLENGNPVLCADEDGSIYRTHGEMCRVMDDLAAIVSV